MSRHLAFPTLLGALLTVLGAAGSASAATCESLAPLAFPDAMITAAQLVPAGSGPAKDLPEYCRVAATLRPSSDSDIKVEVWLPATGWNSKFLAVGNGGWNGSIDAGALATGLRRGYAVSATDTGHQGGGGPWMASPEKVVDFGHRALRRITDWTCRTCFGAPSFGNPKSSSRVAP